MAFIANQYNYATPLSSVVNFGSADSTAIDDKYFTLLDNTLDGSFHPISGDAGLWGTTASDANGNLSSPFIVEAKNAVSVNALFVKGSQYSYPVDFTVELLKDTDVLDTISVVGNTDHVFTKYLPAAFNTTGYRLTVTKISAPNSVVRILNTYTPDYVKRAERVVIGTRDIGVGGPVFDLRTTDLALVAVNDVPSALTNIINTTHDVLDVTCIPRGSIRNVHSVMKSPSRHVQGKVYITYTDPMLESTVHYDTTPMAHNSSISDTNDSIGTSRHNYFTLYENNLTGEYTPIGSDESIGWVSKQLSSDNGFFTGTMPSLSLTFSERPIVNFAITFDGSRGALVKDFTITFTHANNDTTVRNFTDNELTTVVIPEILTDVVAITITVTRVAKAGYPAIILEAPVVSTKLYAGYKDTSNLVSIDLLEELSYDDDIEALGGVSANEVTIVLDNSTKEFFFNNPESMIARFLRRNRKIVPWLGVEVAPGEVEWYSLGTFWSHTWDVPVEGLTAKVTAFDTIGLLDTTSFTAHQTLVNKSIGELVEYVLEDAKQLLRFIEYSIDPDLYDVRIPYAWFDASSHTAALRKLSSCFPMHIYCDRSGTICAAAQKLHLGHYYDTWSNSTNVISTKYNSMYTTIPNIVNINVYSPTVVRDDALATDLLQFNVATVPTRILNFSNPYVSDISVTVDCDPTVRYEYAVYSWGIEFTFSGTGNVRSISCAGNVVDIGDSSIISKRDANSIRLNGAITRDVSSDFIQSSEHAALLLARMDELAKQDIYDATIDYRGNIALSINDPILLLDSIAPINKYNIKRHELFWNGALSGSAYLNT